MPVDLEMQEVGRQEGAGSGNWILQVTQKIKEDAKGVLVSSRPPYFRRFDQINDENVQSFPSIFRPRRQVAVAAPMPVLAQTPSQQQPLDHTSSRRSTDGNVIVAAVGPYHHESPESPPPLITRAKKCAIVEFLARPELGLDTATFLEWALEKDAEARGCYEPESFTMGPQELAEMHLFDGCLVLFAVFLLSKSSVREDKLRPYPFCLATDQPLSARKSSVRDPKRAPPTTGGSSSEPARTSGRGKPAEDFTYLTADISQHMKETRLDLLLLGNQIPFFVLTELHSRLKGTFFQGITRSIQELALSCFDDIRPGPCGFSKKIDGEALPLPQKVHHLLHLFHWSRVPPGKPSVDDDSPPLHGEPESNLLPLFHCFPVPPDEHAVVNYTPPLVGVGEPESNLPCATWFKDSRIGLSTDAAAPGAMHMAFHRSMLGTRGVLRVPALHIHGYSAVVFHNLIAFEQSYRRCGLSATTYCLCMARQLQSEADAKLLRRSGILAHTHKTDEEIVALFRGLAEEYRYRHDSYSRDLLDLCKDVDAHRHSRAARAARSVMLQCFPKQTFTFFVILGAVISIATLANTIFAIIRFYHPVKQ